MSKNPDYPEILDESAVGLIRLTDLLGAHQLSADQQVLMITHIDIIAFATKFALVKEASFIYE